MLVCIWGSITKFPILNAISRKCRVCTSENILFPTLNPPRGFGFWMPNVLQNWGPILQFPEGWDHSQNNLLLMIVQIVENRSLEIGGRSWLWKSWSGCKWTHVYERSYIWTAEIDMKTSLIITVIHTT